MSDQVLPQTFPKTFPKNRRLLESSEYKSVLTHGCRKKTDHFILYLCPNQRPQHRLGLIITKKVANSVHRNRMKRVIREFFRSRHQELAQHYPMHDIVFIVKRGQSEITLATLERELKDVYEEDGFNLNSAIPRRGLPLSA